MPAEIQNFLVATDGSESAGRALDVAAAMAKAAHGTLKIVTVGESPTALQQTGSGPAKAHIYLSDFCRKRNNEPAGLM